VVVRLAPSADRLFAHVMFRVALINVTLSLRYIFFLLVFCFRLHWLLSRVSESNFVPGLVSRVNLDPNVFLTSPRHRLSSGLRTLPPRLSSRLQSVLRST